MYGDGLHLDRLAGHFRGGSSTNIGSNAMVDTVLCAPVSLSYQPLPLAPSIGCGLLPCQVDTIDTSVAEFSVDVVDEVMTFDLGVQASLNQSACTSPSQWTVTVVPEPVAELSAVEAFCGDVFAPEVEYTAEHGGRPTWDWTGGALPATFPDALGIGILGHDVFVVDGHLDASGRLLCGHRLHSLSTTNPSPGLS